MSAGHSGRLGDRIWVFFLRLAPLRLYTLLVRGLASIPLARPLRRPILGFLARRMGMDLGEAEFPVGDYRTLGQLFVRRLKPGARPVAPADEAVVCPVDGSAVAAGEAVAGELIQAKGVGYRLADLLGDEALARKLEGGAYVTLYLRPRDYHRIHSPVTGDVVATRHLPGALYPVQPAVVRQLQGLFVRNERLVLELQGEAGVVALVCVGATAVGCITTVFGAPRGYRTYEPPVPTQKGAELAAFNLGSTVIVIFEPGRVKLADLQPPQEVRVGQLIGDMTSCGT